MPKQAANIIWNWKTSRHTSEQAKSSRRKRRWLQTAGMMVASLLLFRFGDHRVFPMLLWSAAAVALTGLCFSDRILQGIDKTERVLARWLGTGLTWLLLAPFFYTVFGVGRLCLILTRKDRLQRQWDPQAATYWCDHGNTKERPRYQEQS
ncbi:MAG TPA: hypothetical protein DCS43_06090 [Verrucomicrobia bacterium]|nr:hypothetical protein [Verrucomicrobiota bacterium]